MGKTEFARIDLYELVWSVSVNSLSQKYNISSANLRAVCKQMDIPTPDSAYWSKLKFGKPTIKKELPESLKEYKVISLWLRGDEEGEEYFANLASRFKKKEIELKRKIDSAKTEKVKGNLHDPLIVNTREYLIQRSKRNWDYKKKSNTLDIDVSEKLLSRALLIMSNFIAHLKARGYGIDVTESNTFAIVMEEKFEISIKEKSTREKVKDLHWDYTQLVSNGKLSFRCGKSYYIKEWIDGSILIEDRIELIINYLEIKAQQNKIERERREQYWAEQELLKQKRREQKEREEKELRDFKSMFQLSYRYQQAIYLRNYIDKVEQHAIQSDTLTDDLRDWISWARKKADWYDPFIEVLDELLDKVDKETLCFKDK